MAHSGGREPVEHRPLATEGLLSVAGGPDWACERINPGRQEERTKVAITAASGQLGSQVVEALLALIPGTNIVGLARTPDKAKHLGIEIRPGDYNEKDVLEESLRSVDVVLLVSGMEAPERRITQHRNVIEAAGRAGVKKIV